MDKPTWRRMFLAAFCSACWWLGPLGLSVTMTMLEPTVAWAQENDAEPAAEEPGAAAGTDQPQPQNALSWVFKSLGIGYTLVFLSLSFTMVALVVMNLLTARRENVAPVALVENFESQLNEKQWNAAYELAKQDESFLAHVLAAGLPQLRRGYQQAIEAMQEVGEEENMKMNHRLSYLALIGTVSPMIGLFGTVHGMINSFYEIATAGATPNPAKLAEGISTALFTTLAGLAIAIPAIAFYSILRNRMARLVLEVGVVSEGLMSRFQEVGGKKAPGD